MICQVCVCKNSKSLKNVNTSYYYSSSFTTKQKCCHDVLTPFEIKYSVEIWTDFQLHKQRRLYVCCIFWCGRRVKLRLILRTRGEGLIITQKHPVRDVWCCEGSYHRFIINSNVGEGELGLSNRAGCSSFIPIHQ